MTTSKSGEPTAKARAVGVTKDALTVDLNDGRTIIVPLMWFPRLVHGSARERRHWQLIGQGHGIHWPDLDEDISVSNLLEGKPFRREPTISPALVAATRREKAECLTEKYHD